MLFILVSDLICHKNISFTYTKIIQELFGDQLSLIVYEIAMYFQTIY